MQYVFIALGTFLVFLLLLLELTGGTLRNLFGFFVEELDENRVPVHPISLSLKRTPPQAAVPEPEPEGLPGAEPHVRRRKRELPPEQERTVTAILTHKIDERKRVVDSNGHSTLYNEYFELVFETKHGETLRLVAPRVAFKETPFNQDGTLTYDGDRFISFRYAKPTINTNHPA